jgi:predicted RND superfamily exporter protein
MDSILLIMLIAVSVSYAHHFMNDKRERRILASERDYYKKLLEITVNKIK